MYITVRQVLISLSSLSGALRLLRSALEEILETIGFVLISL